MCRVILEDFNFCLDKIWILVMLFNFFDFDNFIFFFGLGFVNLNLLYGICNGFFISCKFLNLVDEFLGICFLFVFVFLFLLFLWVGLRVEVDEVDKYDLFVLVSWYIDKGRDLWFCGVFNVFSLFWYVLCCDRVFVLSFLISLEWEGVCVVVVFWMEDGDWGCLDVENGLDFGEFVVEWGRLVE